MFKKVKIYTYKINNIKTKRMVIKIFIILKRLKISILKNLCICICKLCIYKNKLLKQFFIDEKFV